MTVQIIAAWENGGKDHTLFPGLDEVARDLASEFPALGIGAGYDEEGTDETDYAAALWDRLREPDEPYKPKWHPDILRTAAELVHAAPQGGKRFGPMTFSSAKFEEYLTRTGLSWPRLDSGALAPCPPKS